MDHEFDDDDRDADAMMEGGTLNSGFSCFDRFIFTALLPGKARSTGVQGGLTSGMGGYLDRLARGKWEGKGRRKMDGLSRYEPREGARGVYLEQNERIVRLHRGWKWKWEWRGSNVFKTSLISILVFESSIPLF